MDQQSTERPSPDPTEPIDRLLRDLRSDRKGLTSRDAQRRLIQVGSNEIVRRTGRHWPQQLARQFTHPLALLLWGAAALAWVAHVSTIGLAIIAVIVLNAAFAFLQERQAEQAVEALAAYMPDRAKAFRDGRLETIDARDLVPGDVVSIGEGDRICADARLIDGALEVDLSTLTGESVPVSRSAQAIALTATILDAPELVFSGTTCTEGEATALVFATGMHSELGRIAALSEQVTAEPSPLEDQVRRVAWLIAAVAVGMGIAFMPIAMLGAGLSVGNAAVFAIGLLVGNVPEGLLPVITLALAVGVRELASEGAVVKRLSAVETLGSTTVICTDKTGTLTENRMTVRSLWTPASQPPLKLAETLASCTTARLEGEHSTGDPMELAILKAAAELGVDVDADNRDTSRAARFAFDPLLKRMTTVDRRGGGSWIDTKGSPESVIPICTSIASGDGQTRPLNAEALDSLNRTVEQFARSGLRVLAAATRQIDPDTTAPSRDQAERDLELVGLVALVDPPREEVAAAVAACHRAGIRVIVVTGDHSLTATAIAREVGIVGDEEPTVLDGPAADAMTDSELSEALATDTSLIFSRSSPQAKLRIADALRDQGEIVAMTGDGANDAPALRRADIGVAMGLSGTDVAREASTMVLTDDNFASITAAIGAGRRVFDNVRKFIFYIFAHATPEVVPFLVFALSGGSIPLPLTVPLLLMVDVGTETLPALALGREAAEPGQMDRPPRAKGDGIIRGGMLIRAWLFVGLISAALEMFAFLFVLDRAGWSPGDPTGPGTHLHQDYLKATTMTFAAMVMCQVGTAFAARCERTSLRSIGVFSNRLLIWGILFELALTGLIIYAPPLQDLLSTAALGPSELALLAPFPLIVWGADEIRRWLIRRASPLQATDLSAVT